MWANVEPTKSDGVSGSPVLVALALRAFDLPAGKVIRQPELGKWRPWRGLDEYVYLGMRR